MNKLEFRRRGGWLASIVLLILLLVMLRYARSYFTSLFFYPDRDVVSDPSLYNISYDDVTFPGEGGRRLHGFFMTPKTASKGTIVHCHGNAGNISGHFPLVQFLVDGGYNVLSFDYGGYGRSEGLPSPEGIVADTRAAIAYVRSRPDVDPDRMGLFGQSLGGAAAFGAMRKEPALKSLAVEGTFTTFREMASQTRLGKSLFFLVPFVIPKVGPAIDAAHIGGRPVLILHGSADDLIPPKFARQLHALAPESTTLHILTGLGHLVGGETHPTYNRLLMEFFDRTLVSTNR